MSDFPSSWIEVELGNIFSLHYGKSLPEYARSGDGFPVYGSNGIIGHHNSTLTSEQALIIGRKGSVGEIHFSSMPCSPIDTTYYIDQFYGMPPRYWFYQLKNLRLAELNKATAIPGLNREDAYHQKIYLAPLKEQRRIANKLDNLFARLDECRVRLKRVPLILDLFRQSVLNAAMSGNLTKDWRKEYSDTRKNISKLLARIEEERKQGCHGKYQEPILPNKPISKNVPQSWALMTLDQLSTLITSGSRGWAKYYSNSGAYFIRAQNINSDRLILDDVAYVNPPTGSEGERTKVQEDDLLITITGANVTKAALVDCDLSEAYINQHIGMARLVPSICQKFVHFWIISPSYGRAQLKENIHGGKPGLNLTNLKEMLIALPSVEEQEEIVRRLESLLNYADRLETNYQNAIRKVERVASSLLKTAFRGELVEQNPSDESSSALLERIQVEKMSKPKSAFNNKRPKMTKSPKVTKEYVKEIIGQLPQEIFSFDELREQMPGEYNVLKDVLFDLLDDSESDIMQIFDQELEAIRFTRRSK
jgi:type I restriction enzyme S subunit